MARPRKNDSNELIRLIDEYFSSEAAGDPSKLKSSLLEKYAYAHGVTAKAYDFRRDPEVQAHISYLKKLVSDERGSSIVGEGSYKTLDIRSLIRKYKDPEELISVLSEMDEYWKNVYDACQSADAELTGCRKQLSALHDELKALKENASSHSAEIRSLKSENYRLLVENRYLRSMLRTYLYPALADTILQEEHVLHIDEKALSADAEKGLIDSSFPSSVSEAVQKDRSMQSREENLLEKMWDSIGGFHE